MQIEQIKEVLDWTRKYHHQMSLCYEHCANQSESKRIKLLLECLADHEHNLADTITKYEAQADVKALNTWCYEYLDKNPILANTLCQTNFHELTTDQIVANMLELHNQLITFYQHLAGRGGTKHTRELFNNLVQLEQHEAMCMARDTQRLEGS